MFSEKQFSNNTSLMIRPREMSQFRSSSSWLILLTKKTSFWNFSSTTGSKWVMEVARAAWTHWAIHLCPMSELPSQLLSVIKQSTIDKWRVTSDKRASASNWWPSVHLSGPRDCGWSTHNNWFVVESIPNESHRLRASCGLFGG